MLSRSAGMMCSHDHLRDVEAVARRPFARGCTTRALPGRAACPPCARCADRSRPARSNAARRKAMFTPSGTRAPNSIGSRAVVEQRDHRPLLAAVIGKPRRTRRAPDRQDPSADVVALQAREPFGRSIQPVRRHPHVVVGRDDDVAAGRPRSRRSARGCVPARARTGSAARTGNVRAASSTTCRVSSGELLSTTMTSHGPSGCSDARLASVSRRSAARL